MVHSGVQNEFFSIFDVDITELLNNLDIQIAEGPTLAIIERLVY